MLSSTSAPEVEPGLDGSTSPGAFVQLAEAEVAAAYRVAGFLLHDADEAQDATQEALLRAWRAWPGLRERARFSAWFGQILVNTCRNRLRDRHGVRWVPLDDETADAPTSIDPFRAAIARDELGRLVARLSRDHQIVIALRFWGDYSLQEISDRLEVPLGTVKSRLHNAIEALREEHESQSKGRSR